jgi:hypothetical protein
MADAIGAVRSIRDELDIRNVISQLAHYADDGDAARYGALMSDDCLYERFPTQGEVVRFRGREDVIAAAAERWRAGERGRNSHTRHVVTTIAIVLNGDTAEAKSYMCVYGNAHARPEILSMVVYNDRFERTNTGWRLSARVATPA